MIRSTVHYLTVGRTPSQHLLTQVSIFNIWQRLESALFDNIILCLVQYGKLIVSKRSTARLTYYYYILFFRILQNSSFPDVYEVHRSVDSIDLVTVERERVYPPDLARRQIVARFFRAHLASCVQRTDRALN